ncbi:facilitated trehalose transporter Tret1-like [Chironomus tepperi]|uniref:facilitated trehalose transporter Tret1-like n=1 Tax=Chironomus tepperi TaxID=113505 RepID=UPI00391FA246
MKLFKFCASSTKNQFIATAIVNLLALSHGLGLGWSSPAIQYLASESTHLKAGPASHGQLSWIGASITLGALVGTLLAGCLAECMGKKRSLMILALPNFGFWVLTYFAISVREIIIGRFIGGITGGGIFRILSLYIADIAENNIRGGLGSIFPLIMYTGMLIMFIMGSYMNYFVVSGLSATIPIAAYFLMLRLPETPHFLIQRMKYDEALKSLKFYRTLHPKSSEEEIKKVEDEFEMMKIAVENATSETVQWSDFMTKKAKRGMALGIFLVFLLAFSGNTVIMQYTAFIFKITGSSLPPNEASIIIAAMQVIGILIMGLLVDRIGRRKLMIISCVGSTATLTLMAIYTLCKETWAFPQTAVALGLSACFWFFASVCAIGVFVLFFFMPETMGKDLLADQ